jgi:hypothetical protein
MTYQNEAQNLQTCGCQHSLFRAVLSRNYPVTQQNGISGIQVNVAAEVPSAPSSPPAPQGDSYDRLSDMARGVMQMHAQMMARSTRFNSHLYGGLCPCPKQYLLPC